eukprot:4824930-Ditylum_brightwellii.AAC.1
MKIRVLRQDVCSIVDMVERKRKSTEMMCPMVKAVHIMLVHPIMSHMSHKPAPIPKHKTFKLNALQRICCYKRMIFAAR